MSELKKTAPKGCLKKAILLNQKIVYSASTYCFLGLGESSICSLCFRSFFCAYFISFASTFPSKLMSASLFPVQFDHIINVCTHFVYIKIIVRLPLTESYWGFNQDSQPISTANLRGILLKQTIEIVT